MKNQLITVASHSVGSETIPTVNAREMHTFLEVGKDFSTWIKVQIERARLIENRDFVIVKAPLSGGAAGNRGLTIDYHLTLEAGKHVAMMSQTDKGFEVRDYFIECERRAKNPLAALNDPAAMRSLLLGYCERVIEQDKLIAAIQPKADIADRLSGSDGNICIRNAAKALKIRETDLIRWLLIHKWVYRNKKGKLEGYAACTPRFIEHKVTPIPVDGDADRVSLQVMITPEGLTRLAGIFNAVLEVAA
jgi:phage anti-repressor protein/phage antirepressor YoqD-like protein